MTTRNRSTSKPSPKPVEPEFDEGTDEPTDDTVAPSAGVADPDAVILDDSTVGPVPETVDSPDEDADDDTPIFRGLDAESDEPTVYSFTGPSRGLQIGDWFAAGIRPGSNYGDADHGAWSTTDPELADKFRSIAGLYDWTEVDPDAESDLDD